MRIAFGHIPDLEHRKAMTRKVITCRTTFASDKVVEGLVDLLQPERACDQLVHRHAPLAVELDEGRDVTSGHAGTDVAALDGARLGDDARNAGN